MSYFVGAGPCACPDIKGQPQRVAPTMKFIIVQKIFDIQGFKRVLKQFGYKE